MTFMTLAVMGRIKNDCCTGDSAKRLVGMLLPKGAVDDLLQELHEQKEFEAQAQHALSSTNQMTPAELSHYSF